MYASSQSGSGSGQDCSGAAVVSVWGTADEPSGDPSGVADDVAVDCESLFCLSMRFSLK